MKVLFIPSGLGSLELGADKRGERASLETLRRGREREGERGGEE